MAMMGSGSATGPDRAREAAEAAVLSELLEDVNISGAKGILVNVTAGEDMGLTEYSEVGATIGNYAHDDATVVVGTVIDPSLGNELRVTLVATGLSAPMPAAETTPMQPEQVVDLGDFKKDVQRMPVKNLGMIVDDGVVDEAEERQVSKKASGNNGRREVTAGISAEELIEIPAFLRKQAD